MQDVVTSVVGLISSFVFLAFIFGNPGAWFTTWVESRERVRRDELRTRRVEAFAKMGDAERKLLAESMPDWIDSDDPAEVAAWKKARAELAKKS
jgi:hypothetical protein